MLLEGPRTVGKSTLLRALAREVDGEVVDLDDLATRGAVQADPALMLASDRPVLIDEYQLVPEVLDAIKARLNRSSRPGQFVLTGSARHGALPRAAQSLTGRLQALPVLPLAQVELGGAPGGLLERLLASPSEAIAGRESTTSRADYVDRIARGGFPLALAAGGEAARGRWIDSYVRLTLERDVEALSRIRQAHTLPLVLARLAGQTAQVLNGSGVADNLGINDKTARDYVRLLEAVFLVRILPAWDRTISARATARPKVHVVDSGVATRLLKLTPERLARRESTALTQFGHLLESFVVGEILAQASWTEGLTHAGHYRNRDAVEVDLVLEADDGRVLAFEIKAAGRVTGKDFGGLAHLRDRLGSAFVAGVVLYTGSRGYTYGDRLHALPIDRLWAPDA